ncbi:MAG TPA: hypothetical protein VMV03_17635 [Spirochaetia bacterium]|nr:hypothetical protein [Spirochaetia bacterium]
MRASIVGALAILAVLPALAQAATFRSNDFGMQLEPIASYRRHEYRWVLDVSRTPRGETRRLFDGGKEARRWETTETTGGGTEEKEFAGSTMTARRIYSPAGDLLQEEQYSGGALSQKSVLIYTASRLSRMRVLSADGTPLYTLDYLYTTRGGLREVRRTEGDVVSRDSAFVAGSSGLSEERNRIGDTTFVSRYDTRGRLIEEERRDQDGAASTEEFAYRENTDHLAASVEKEPRSGRVTERRYDKDGRLVSETMSAGGKVTEETAYALDGKGREIGRERRSAAGLEQWKYTLDSAGKKTREEYLRRGALSKITLYGAGSSRTEELYENGELFLKAFFDGDRRIREEVYADGKVVRTRSFE